MGQRPNASFSPFFGGFAAEKRGKEGFLLLSHWLNSSRPSPRFIRNLRYLQSNARGGGVREAMSST